MLARRVAKIWLHVVPGVCVSARAHKIRRREDPSFAAARSIALGGFALMSVIGIAPRHPMRLLALRLRGLVRAG